MAAFLDWVYNVKFLIDNGFLIATAIISGGMLLWQSLNKRQSGNSVTTLQATQLMNKNSALVVDVRDAEEFGKGRMLKSQNIPIAQLAEKAAGLSKKKDNPVIVVCQRGQLAQRACALLAKAGYTEVFALHGGLDAWREAGLPIEK